MLNWELLNYSKNPLRTPVGGNFRTLVAGQAGLITLTLLTAHTGFKFKKLFLHYLCSLCSRHTGRKRFGNCRQLFEKCCEGIRTGKNQLPTPVGGNWALLCLLHFSVVKHFTKTHNLY